MGSLKMAGVGQFVTRFLAAIAQKLAEITAQALVWLLFGFLTNI
jgi:hypothetical protein